LVLTCFQEIAPGQEETLGDDGLAQNTADPDVDGQIGQDEAGRNGVNSQDVGQSEISQTPGFGMGFDAMAGGFPNMGMMGAGGDINQMQMMMAMQNGMAPNAFGGFPMMSKST
jgi:hypothetical protein